MDDDRTFRDKLISAAVLRLKHAQKQLDYACEVPDEETAEKLLQFGTPV